MAPQNNSQLELWGGAECTVNRVGNSFFDQLTATGHDSRDQDIDLLAALNLRAVRFPVLWERVSPNGPERQDWRWSDERLARLRELGLRPIVGLVHHGSGPAHTSLLDDGFAAGLADHAARAAERYPWVRDWTPVNEPLTTARFATLYGHWYPHVREERGFWTALVNQVDAVRLSMRAIRSVIPDARLIQTEDFGRTYATAAIADQAGFDNVRRWMSWDLLCGRVEPGHPLWARLCEHGLEPRLRAISEQPCPPDVIGINHYLTSDRFLDHRVQRYPAERCGGNGRQAFADVEAVRVLEPPPQGIAGAIDEVWQRYRLPIAITEVHNGCTRDEQLRWLHQAWNAAVTARQSGIDVRAVTVWALFGNRGWNTLLTGSGIYESGVYDVSGGAPRATALAGLIKALPQAGAPHPVLDGSGWWRRDIRLVHPPTPRPAHIREHLRPAAATGAPILITGATGTLGRALAAACRHRHLRHLLTARSTLDLGDPASIASALDANRPWAVINAAGWVRVDDAEDAPDACLAANAGGAAALARACSERGIPTVAFSSDLVFDGAKPAYHESDAPAPLNVYGRSKAAMEQELLALPGDHLVIRTAAFFSPFDEANFAVHAVRTLRRGERFVAAGDCTVTPTYVPDLCNAALDLLIDGATGVWHLSNGEALSWAEFALRIVEACGLDGSLVEPRAATELGWPAVRPARCALASERGALMPDLASAIARFAAHLPATIEVRAAA
ncbi:MAG: SDR family oxidoreductase [Novosphingobium sp.]|nr:SDR family oxidoreductase [Novosphingobium sp.]